MGKKVLIVDDEEGIRETLKDILQLYDFDVSTDSSGEDAITSIANKSYDIVLLDYKMNGIDGVTTYFKMKEIQPEIKVVFITAYYNEQAINDALRSGAVGVCNKPLDIQNLLKIIQ